MLSRPVSFQSQTHFHRLQKLLSEGKLILAGRTLNEDATAFGIVILEVDSEDEARNLPRNGSENRDTAYSTATLHWAMTRRT